MLRCFLGSDTLTKALSRSALRRSPVYFPVFRGVYAVTQQNVAAAHSTAAAASRAPSAVRIAKVIARSGVGSRRQGEEMIVAGRVSVNGQPISSPALNVDPSRDAIAVDGRSVTTAQRAVELFLMHKLKGEAIRDMPSSAGGAVSAAGGRGGAPSTAASPSTGDRLSLMQRATLMGLPPQLIAVGGLDFNTTGLQLLTTAPALARVLEHGANGGTFTREYELRVYGRHIGRAVRALRNGGHISGIGKLAACVVTVLSKSQESSRGAAVARGSLAPDRTPQSPPDAQADQVGGSGGSSTGVNAGSEALASSSTGERAADSADFNDDNVPTSVWLGVRMTDGNVRIRHADMYGGERRVCA